VTIDRLKRLEGNLFLGTSPFYGIVAEILDDALIKAVNNGLENMIVFESDFTLDDLERRGIEEYECTLRSVIESIGENEKVLYENIRPFLE
jgi:hypothetical protein